MADLIPDDAPHLAPIVTDRGFTHLPAIPCSYGGAARVYESSAAMAPHVWLKAVDSDGHEATLHLAAENAWRLAEQLMHLVQHHYHGDARPAELRSTTKGDTAHG